MKGNNWMMRNKQKDTKLKTLKDIEGLDKGCANLARQEAIKWVQFRRKNVIVDAETDWMDFFNITEEDLK